MDGVAQESYDSLSLFLCIQLVKKFNNLCHKKKISILDKYWDQLYTVLWSRFKTLMQLNTQSIKDCDPMKMKEAVDQRPHYVRKKKSNFVA